jgi:lincosamide and streptogramin A transport system ATP-binding/permease protein
MSLISVLDLTFGYEGSFDNVFEHLSFEIDTDWKLGLIGRNGRGKTTLLRLLMGDFDHSGSIASSVSFDYFPFSVGDPSQDTLDALCRAAPGAEQWRIRRELSLLGLPDEALARPFATLSHGERTKALLGALFARDNRFLLIDEPTNHLDRSARRAVGEYLSGKRGFILVSHDRALLDRCVDHVLAINPAGIELQKGNFSSWRHNRDLQDAFEQAEHDRLTREARRLGEAAHRTSGWADRVEKSKFGVKDGGPRPDRGYIGHKSAKMAKRAKAVHNRRARAAEEKSVLLKNFESAGELAIHPLTHHAKTLVEARDLSVCYNQNPVFAPMSFSIGRGERVALTGKNGAGKSSILRLAAGQQIPHTGRVQTASGLIVSLLPQDTSFLRGGLRRFAGESGIDESLFLAILRRLGFSREQFDRDLSALSAGQKKKALIAKSLCERAHLYLWDEPLNHIDLFSRMQIEQLLCEFAPSMLFVEHDDMFIRAVATRELAL